MPSTSAYPSTSPSPDRPPAPTPPMAPILHQPLPHRPHSHRPPTLTTYPPWDSHQSFGATSFNHPQQNLPVPQLDLPPQMSTSNHVRQSSLGLHDESSTTNESSFDWASDPVHVQSVPYHSSASYGPNLLPSRPSGSHPHAMRSWTLDSPSRSSLSASPQALLSLPLTRSPLHHPVPIAGSPAFSYSSNLTHRSNDAGRRIVSLSPHALYPALPSTTSERSWTGTSGSRRSSERTGGPPKAKLGGPGGKTYEELQAEKMTRSTSSNGDGSPVKLATTPIAVNRFLDGQSPQAGDMSPGGEDALGNGREEVAKWRSKPVLVRLPPRDYDPEEVIPDPADPEAPSKKRGELFPWPKRPVEPRTVPLPDSPTDATSENVSEEVAAHTTRHNLRPDRMMQAEEPTPESLILGEEGRHPNSRGSTEVNAPGAAKMALLSEETATHVRHSALYASTSQPTLAGLHSPTSNRMQMNEGSPDKVFPTPPKSMQWNEDSPDKTLSSIHLEDSPEKTLSSIQLDPESSDKTFPSTQYSPDKTLLSIQSDQDSPIKVFSAIPPNYPTNHSKSEVPTPFQSTRGFPSDYILPTSPHSTQQHHGSPGRRSVPLFGLNLPDQSPVSQRRTDIIVKEPLAGRKYGDVILDDADHVRHQNRVSSRGGLGNEAFLKRQLGALFKGPAERKLSGHRKSLEMSVEHVDKNVKTVGEKVEKRQGVFKEDEFEDVPLTANEDLHPSSHRLETQGDFSDKMTDEEDIITPSPLKRSRAELVSPEQRTNGESERLAKVNPSGQALGKKEEEDVFSASIISPTKSRFNNYLSRQLGSLLKTEVPRAKRRTSSVNLDLQNAQVLESLVMASNEDEPEAAGIFDGSEGLNAKTNNEGINPKDRPRIEPKRNKNEEVNRGGLKEREEKNMEREDQVEELQSEESDDEIDGYQVKTLYSEQAGQVPNSPASAIHKLLRGREQSELINSSILQSPQFKHLSSDDDNGAPTSPFASQLDRAKYTKIGVLLVNEGFDNAPTQEIKDGDLSASLKEIPLNRKQSAQLINMSSSQLVKEAEPISKVDFTGTTPLMNSTTGTHQPTVSQDSDLRTMGKNTKKNGESEKLKHHRTLSASAKPFNPLKRMRPTAAVFVPRSIGGSGTQSRTSSVDLSREMSVRSSVDIPNDCTVYNPTPTNIVGTQWSRSVLVGDEADGSTFTHGTISLENHETHSLKHLGMQAPDPEFGKDTDRIVGTLRATAPVFEPIRHDGSTSHARQISLYRVVPEHSTMLENNIMPTRGISEELQGMQSEIDEPPADWNEGKGAESDSMDNHSHSLPIMVTGIPPPEGPQTARDQQIGSLMGTSKVPAHELIWSTLEAGGPTADSPFEDVPNKSVIDMTNPDFENSGGVSHSSYGTSSLNAGVRSGDMILNPASMNIQDNGSREMVTPNEEEWQSEYMETLMKPDEDDDIDEGMEELFYATPLPSDEDSVGSGLVPLPIRGSASPRVSITGMGVVVDVEGISDLSPAPADDIRSPRHERPPASRKPFNSHLSKDVLEATLPPEPPADGMGMAISSFPLEHQSGGMDINILPSQPLPSRHTTTLPQSRTVEVLKPDVPVSASTHATSNSLVSASAGLDIHLKPEEETRSLRNLLDPQSKPFTNFHVGQTSGLPNVDSQKPSESDEDHQRRMFSLKRSTPPRPSDQRQTSTQQLNPHSSTFNPTSKGKGVLRPNAAPFIFGSPPSVERQEFHPDLPKLSVLAQPFMPRKLDVAEPGSPKLSVFAPVFMPKDSNVSEPGSPRLSVSAPPFLPQDLNAPKVGPPALSVFAPPFVPDHPKVTESSQSNRSDLVVPQIPDPSITTSSPRLDHKQSSTNAHKSSHVLSGNGPPLQLHDSPQPMSRSRSPTYLHNTPPHKTKQRPTDDDWPSPSESAAFDPEYLDIPASGSVFITEPESDHIHRDSSTPHIRVSADDDNRFRSWVYPVHASHPSISRRHTMSGEQAEVPEPVAGAGVASTKTTTLASRVQDLRTFLQVHGRLPIPTSEGGIASTSSDQVTGEANVVQEQESNEREDGLLNVNGTNLSRPTASAQSSAEFPMRDGAGKAQERVVSHTPSPGEGSKEMMDAIAGLVSSLRSHEANMRDYAEKREGEAKVFSEEVKDALVGLTNSVQDILSSPAPKSPNPLLHHISDMLENHSHILESLQEMQDRLAPPPISAFSDSLSPSPQPELSTRPNLSAQSPESGSSTNEVGPQSGSNESVTGHERAQEMFGALLTGQHALLDKITELSDRHDISHTVSSEVDRRDVEITDLTRLVRESQEKVKSTEDTLIIVKRQRDAVRDEMNGMESSIKKMEEKQKEMIGEMDACVAARLAAELERDHVKKEMSEMKLVVARRDVELSKANKMLEAERNKPPLPSVSTPELTLPLQQLLQDEVISRLSRLDEAMHETMSSRVKEYAQVLDRNKHLETDLDSLRKRLDTITEENLQLQLVQTSNSEIHKSSISSLQQSLQKAISANETSTSEVESIREQLVRSQYTLDENRISHQREIEGLLLSKQEDMRNSEKERNKLLEEVKFKDQELKDMKEESNKMKEERDNWKMIAREREAKTKLQEMRINGLTQESWAWKNYALEIDRKQFKSFIKRNPDLAKGQEKDEGRERADSDVTIKGKEKGTWWDLGSDKVGNVSVGL
ncbi:hypothetical protein TREMEDRAFT_64642 [Tremella mesenterica DSM 1558]|uniref:uncharacterized protein n=1 Tax=Tremella mesenterica (strain ATCC 24925 / CBS 8224 / DSM 1558 / NBRC 9311 / NRRL Y-6157 / RJB 2259-6 / UBC 559-6) TaxID=578456 RepID=UPI0003F499CF|nr:uncharacterized protein TREMEDRAFT_64642 [Tremella mesenterica DSM 1558]EIW67389.1 hypothetical protein TREMEDRAFT_64642 [Tremella mesenterica DSM 1558]